MKRGEGKIKSDYTLKDAYKVFCSKLVKSENLDGSFTDIKTKYNLNKTLYNQICKDFNNLVVTEIIEKAYEFKIPARLGTFRVRVRKEKLKLTPEGKIDTRKLVVDWKKTKEVWNENPDLREKKKVVFVENSHSDNYRAWWYWSKNYCNVPNKTVYQFIPSRTNKRTLAAAIKREENKPIYHL